MSEDLGLLGGLNEPLMNDKGYWLPGHHTHPLVILKLDDKSLSQSQVPDILYLKIFIIILYL